MEDMENKENSSNVLLTLEDREILEKMKEAKINKLKEIEINKKKSDAIDAGCEIAKGVVKVAGSVLTVVLAVCPLDGPVGEIVTVLGSAALIKAIDSSKDLLKASLVNKDPSEISSALVDLSGNIKEIKIKDNDLVENVDKSQLEQESFNSNELELESSLKL